MSFHLLKTFGGGFVKELVTYMVMDNSEFRPMSTKDFVTLFNHLRLEKEVTELEEMVVDFGMDEVGQLLLYLHTHVYSH